MQLLTAGGHRAGPDARPDWDAPGVLSIVVQGGLFQGNLIETANHCRHWRELFPAAEIVLSLSVTDAVAGQLQGGVLTDIGLVPRHRQDGQLQAALDAIVASCTVIGLSAGALPLPPIKTDSPKPNNMNLQIVAAQHGLALATGRYVLRIRSDMTFQDRGFLGQHADAAGLERRDAAVLRERVLISWLFTLNPYTLERLPLHFSDWFHFGLTEDVRRLWQAPLITLRDSIHYRTHRHAPGSKASERLFDTRLAVEQHLLYHCFKDALPGLVLDHHNDQSATALTLDILLDNFVLCDLVRARCVFDKYGGEFTDPGKRYHCITPEDWHAMARARDADHRVTLGEKLAEADGQSAFQLRQPLPRTYDASRLSTRDAQRMNGELVAVGRDGIVFFGPYTALPRGSYLVEVHATTLIGPGTLVLRVTMDAGATVLAEKVVVVEADAAPALRVPFDVAIPQAREVELALRHEGMRELAVSGITFSERSAATDSALQQEADRPLTFDASWLQTRQGRHEGDAIVAVEPKGLLFFGPYTTLPRGQYVATVNTTLLHGPGLLAVRVTADSGGTTLAARRFRFGPGAASAPGIAIAFEVTEWQATKVEVVGSTEGLRGIAVSGITITRRAAAGKSQPAAPPAAAPPAPARTGRSWRGWMSRRGSGR